MVIPVIVGILYRLGGMKQWELELSVFSHHYNLMPNQKVWRWLGVGLFLATVFAIRQKSTIPLILIATYFLAISGFSYGDKIIWRKLLGAKWQMVLSGFMFGLASIVILGKLAIIQAIIGAISFYILKILDDKDVLKNPWQEFLRGVSGTIMYVF